MDYNRVVLVGKLTRDPESRYLPSGTQVCKMGLAVNRRFTTKEGEKREETLFVDIEAWGRTAELCGQYLTKGSEVLIEGRLKSDSFTTQSGEKRTKILVVADEVRFGPKPRGGDGSGGSRPVEQRAAAPRQADTPSAREDSWSSDEPSEYAQDRTEDDLPF